MRRTLAAFVLIVAAGAASQALAQLPATPHLPSFGNGLFSRRSAERPVEPAPATTGVGQASSVFAAPSTVVGREATLQALQNCYAREAPKVKAAGALETRVRRLRQMCENEELADTRAWLKWSKIGAGRSTQRILNALQQDAAEKALTGEAPSLPEKF